MGRDFVFLWLSSAPSLHACLWIQLYQHTLSAFCMQYSYVQRYRSVCMCGCVGVHVRMKERETHTHVCVFFSLFSFLWKHFILWALRTKLETHETIFAMTLGKDTDENKNSLAATAHLCSDAKRVGHRGGGSFTCGYPTGRGMLFTNREWVLRQKMPCGRVGGWVQKKLLAFLTYP